LQATSPWLSGVEVQQILGAFLTTGQSEKGSSDQIKRNNVKESFASPRSTPVTNNRRLYDKEQIARDGGKDVYSDEAGLIVTPLAEAVTKPFCLYRCSLLDL
jgi:hypothetical protein